MVYLSHIEILVEVLHNDCLLIQKLGYYVGFLGVVTQPCRNQLGADVLGTAEPNRFIVALLHES